MKSAFAAILLARAGGGLASPAAAQDWTTSVSGNGLLKAEVPCSEAELAELAARELDQQAMLGSTAPERVLCAKDGIAFLATIKEIPVDAVPGLNFFDLIADAIVNMDDVDGDPQVGERDGRRTIVNRELDDGVLAQTMIVELAPNRIILANAGGPVPEGLTMEELGSMIDRFMDSLTVLG